MRTVIFAVALLAVTSCDNSDGPDVAPEYFNKVVSGRLDGMDDNNSAAGIWGDGVNELCALYSFPGFFYGTDSGLSSADVAVVPYSDPLSINDAESLTYSQEPVYAQPGQTLIFKGLNGFFGAWSIEDIAANGDLYGTWYFRSGGGGDFTAELADVEGPPLQTRGSCP